MKHILQPEGQPEVSALAVGQQATTEQILGLRLFTLASNVMELCVATLGDFASFKHNLKLTPTIAVNIERPRTNQHVQITQESATEHNNDEDGETNSKFVPLSKLRIDFSDLTEDGKKGSITVDDKGEFINLNRKDTQQIGAVIGDAAIVGAFLDDFGKDPYANTDDEDENGFVKEICYSDYPSVMAPHNGWQRNVSISFPTSSRW